MTLNEFAPIVKAMKSMWRKEGFLSDEDTVLLWLNLLQDLPHEVVAKAVYAYMAEEHYPPSVSDIRKRAAGYMTFPIPEWDEQWETVKKAIRRWGYLREKEALESLDEVTALVVKRLGWQRLCSADIDQEMSDRHQFKEIYNHEKTKQERNLSLPDSLKPMIQQPKQEMIEQKVEWDPVLRGTGSPPPDLKERIKNALDSTE